MGIIPSSNFSVHSTTWLYARSRSWIWVSWHTWHPCVPPCLSYTSSMARHSLFSDVHFFVGPTGLMVEVGGAESWGSSWLIECFLMVKLADSWWSWLVEWLFFWWEVAVDGRNPANHLGCIKTCKLWWILHINWCSPDFLTINTHTLLETNSLHLEIGRNCPQKRSKMMQMLQKSPVQVLS